MVQEVGRRRHAGAVREGRAHRPIERSAEAAHQDLRCLAHLQPAEADQRTKADFALRIIEQFLELPGEVAARDAQVAQRRRRGVAVPSSSHLDLPKSDAGIDHQSSCCPVEVCLGL